MKACGESDYIPKSKEEINDGKRMRRRRSILQEFSVNTSTHGIPGIARSESVTNRISGQFH